MARHATLLQDLLVTSIRQNKVEDAKHLLAQLPPHVNLPLVGYSYFTPLLFAASLGRSKIVGHLLSVLSQEHIEAVDNYGRNALMNAVSSGDAETVRLLAAKLDPHSRDQHQNTCLHLARTRDIAVLLLAELALDPQASNLHKCTPMHAAAADAEPEVINALVDAGAQLNSSDEDQWTPLHHAVYHDRRATAMLLIDLGADLEAKNSDGLTPIDLSQDREFAESMTRKVETRHPTGSPLLSSSVPELPMSLELSPPQNHVRPMVLEVDSIGATVGSPAVETTAADMRSSISGLVRKNQGMLSIDLNSLGKYGVEIIRYSELSLREELGRGGYGRVYRGTFRNNKVAIKVVNDRGICDKLVRDFLKEIECLVKIRHHRFLLLQGICLEGPLCIVTELAKGGNLADAIEKGQLERAEKLMISLQIAEGMTFIHSKTPPIIHRDLKPQNILLDSFKQVKIGDLGLSRVIGSATSNTMKLESTELFAGTIRYMAPEHFDDKPEITRGTDVWAFGCILFQLFTGKAPWSGLELPAIQRRLLLKQEFPTDDCLDGEIKALISSCCSLQASARPKFADIIQSLETILGIPSSQID